MCLTSDATITPKGAACAVGGKVRRFVCLHTYSVDSCEEVIIFFSFFEKLGVIFTTPDL